MSAKSLLVVIPCLNEEKTIAAVISAIPNTIKGINRIDVLVVDDGSTDSSVKEAENAGAYYVSHPRNKGVGAAFRTGLNYARVHEYDFMLNMDGDGQFNPNDIPELLAPVLSGEADMTTASRFKDKTLHPKMPAIKKWGNHRISGLVSILTGQKFYDVSCGFRAYSKDVIRTLSLLGNFTYTHEAILQTVFNGFSIIEVPLEIRGEREFGKSRVASNLWRYAKQTSSIIGSTIISHRPFTAFAFIGLFFGVIGISLGVFFMYHRFTTGAFEPHIWAGFSSAYFVGLAVISLLFGQAAFMFTRHHKITKNEMNLLVDTILQQNQKKD
ncbi:glycosyltransferase family 2 protein [Curvivirga aplysinae]|uniref:glycosyltransferase family 2 protein n=1 Tax=Curvivirga aplysinae TaxID=2529852 RepID=UPI0012BBAF78|nr:glycosyltransferase family 2 protein [Curvivirga aplysinae]MTI09389.1 glycosyltransferase family 2 protein [Curvivirga aplysinae]